MDAYQGNVLNSKYTKLTTKSVYVGTVPTYGGDVGAKRIGNTVLLTIYDLCRSSHITVRQDNTISIGLPKKYWPDSTIFTFGTQYGNISGQYAILYTLHTDGALAFYSYNDVTNGRVYFSYITSQPDE